MKNLRAFTAALALVLAILIAIYAVTLYVKFKPDESKKENGQGKLVQFIKSSQTNRDCLRMIFFLMLSASAAVIFRRRPGVPLVFATLTLAFDAQLVANGQFNKHPMAVMILITVHVLSAFALCAAYGRETGGRNARNAGICLSVCAAATSAVTIFAQKRMAQSDMITSVLPEGGFTISPQLKLYPDLVSAVVRKFENYGEDAARDLAGDFASDIEAGAMRLKFLNSIEAGETAAYTRLILALFACAVLAFALWRLPKLASAVSALPFLSVAYCVLFEKMSTLTLPLMVMTFVSFLCFAADGMRKNDPEPDFSDFEDYIQDPEGPTAEELSEYT